jgi:hypothetical protein
LRKFGQQTWRRPSQAVIWFLAAAKIYQQEKEVNISSQCNIGLCMVNQLENLDVVKTLATGFTYYAGGLVDPGEPKSIVVQLEVNSQE